MKWLPLWRYLHFGEDLRVRTVLSYGIWLGFKSPLHHHLTTGAYRHGMGPWRLSQAKNQSSSTSELRCHLSSKTPALNANIRLKPIYQLRITSPTLPRTQILTSDVTAENAITNGSTGYICKCVSPAPLNSKKGTRSLSRTVPVVFAAASPAMDGVSNERYGNIRLLPRR